ncbi:PEP/pyruvate-binding domain-containing protein [uncultured Mycobacterium sp.]|uniref:PEP/pyruvate-binding domain-containing protein n=1 Tax=uncultured Mycobacterium sp. TaxID=171292 RepID=UPI0035C9E6F8
MPKWVYAFGGGAAEGSGSQRDLLGGKGANLAEMAQLGLPVPPGFTVTTEVCTNFYAHDRRYPETDPPRVPRRVGRPGLCRGCQHHRHRALAWADRVRSATGRAGRGSGHAKRLSMREAGE